MTPKRAAPNDEEPELTHDEIHWIREQRKQQQHEQWLRGQIRVIWPWVVAVVGFLVGAVKLIKEHVKW